jgi:hypothetical protein
MPNPAAFVSDVIAATKSENPNLAFGVTIYKDGQNHVALTSLPATLRAQIQFVHLYVHYREDAPSFAVNVTTAKTILSNAKIIAGAYPYDRINYLPCAYKGTWSARRLKRSPCTVQGAVGDSNEYGQRGNSLRCGPASLAGCR